MQAEDTPPQLAAYITQTAPNAPIRLAAGPFILKRDSIEESVSSDLWFRWSPLAGVEFEGQSVLAGGKPFPWPVIGEGWLLSSDMAEGG